MANVSFVRANIVQFCNLMRLEINSTEQGTWAAVTAEVKMIKYSHVLE